MPFLIAIPAIFLIEEIAKIALIVGGAAVAVDATRRTVEAVANNSSTRATHIQYEAPTVESKTLFDWWYEGISNYEREILHEAGIQDKEVKYTLQELKEKVVAYLARAPGKPDGEIAKKVDFKEKKNWGGELVKNPNGGGYGYPDKDGNVWVPSGEGGHGGAHWDKEYAGKNMKGRTRSYSNVFPDGRRR
jgi:hypothetical protein